MSHETKKRNMNGGGLYIALAICILSVICIGVYSAILNIFEPAGYEDVTPLADEDKDNDSHISVETPKVTQKPSTPPTETESDKKEPEHSVNATPEPPGYTMPIAGEIDVDFSGEVLVYSETMNDYRVHRGVDIAATIGSPVKAFSDGVVVEIYEDPMMGQTVVIDHGNETKSIYQNLSPMLPSEIKVGVLVEEGQVIGGVGETVLVECAQVPHLHFEVTVKDVPVDPMEYFE
ncbi:MAG: M23 family metallopeptidase [Clostridia bacterium]|nr:M23 family metallopeptidase [Clostridia bacterium]